MFYCKAIWDNRYFNSISNFRAINTSETHLNDILLIHFFIDLSSFFIFFKKSNIFKVLFNYNSLGKILIMLAKCDIIEVVINILERLAVSSWAVTAIKYDNYSLTMINRQLLFRFREILRRFLNRSPARFSACVGINTWLCTGWANK
jgi:hypothetical protein